MQRLYRCYLRIARHEIRIPSLIYQYIGVYHKLVLRGTRRFTWDVSYIRTRHVRNPKGTYMGSEVFRIWVKTLCFYFHTGSYLPSLPLVPLHSVWSLMNDFCSFNEFHKFFFFRQEGVSERTSVKVLSPSRCLLWIVELGLWILLGRINVDARKSNGKLLGWGIFPGKLYSALVWVVGVILKYLEWSYFFGGSGHLWCCWWCCWQ